MFPLEKNFGENFSISKNYIFFAEAGNNINVYLIGSYYLHTGFLHITLWTLFYIPMDDGHFGYIQKLQKNHYSNIQFSFFPQFSHVPPKVPQKGLAKSGYKTNF